MFAAFSQFHGKPAVYRDDGTRQEVRGPARQKNGRSCHILGLAPAAGRDPGFDTLLQPRDIPLSIRREIGVDESWGDAVYLDIILGPAHSQATGQLHDPSLARSIGWEGLSLFRVTSQRTRTFILFQRVRHFTEYPAQRPWLLYVEFERLSTCLEWIMLIVIIE